ncbi:hypothetical protein KA005_82160 [bacterium]|nr:hypothetical protein [bacterium]
MAFVFAVHKFETITGFHQVAYSNGRKGSTLSFCLWENAEKFARHKAKKLGLEEYQVDEPN